MEQFIVKHPDGSHTLLTSRASVSAVTKAEQIVALLAEDIVTVSVSSATPLQFSLGDTMEVYGKTYTLNQLPSIKKTGERRFAYDLMFEGVQYELIDAQFLLPDNTIGDSLTGTLPDFLQILVDNANRVFPNKWTIGSYPDETEYKTMTFNGDSCLSALQRLCEEYQQEFEIVQKDGARTLHIRQAGVDFPFTFRYGRTGGLYELTRQNVNSQNIVTRLYAYGGSSNVKSAYLNGRHSAKLCLPGKNKNASYIQSSDAVARFGLKENKKDFDDIFPNRYGKVDEVVDYLTFRDNNMPFDLKESDANGTKWLISGVNAKVHFNSGNLAGYEFEIERDAVSAWSGQSQAFKLIPFQDETGEWFPSQTSAAFQLAPGDKYFFVDINLPDAYVAEAEQKLYEEAQAYYEQHSQPRVQYGLTIDESFIAQFGGKLAVPNLFLVGDHIPVQDEDVGVSKSVRITALTRDLMQPYKYAITLSDSVTKTAYIRQLNNIRNLNRIVETNNLADPARARRSWRASQDVLAMTFDPDGDYYSSKIKPLSIETGMLQVGAKSMQFALQGVMFEPNYQSNPSYIRISGGSLVHATIEPTIRAWTIAAVEYSQLVDSAAYYIYARCQRSGSAGSIILDTNQRKVDGEAGYYTFWVGVLNSVVTDDGGGRPARLVSLTYGSSTINGRFLKTGRIESSGGGPGYIDLDSPDGIEIAGKATFYSGSSGYNNIADKPNLSPYDDAVNYLDNALPGALERLQEQIDNAIESWFYHYDPDLTNAPASDWTTAALKEAHLDDTFTNLDSGQSWRFTKDAGSAYSWTLMADSAATKALVLAGQAKDAADGKRRVFVSTPTTPYDVGDLWPNGEILRWCINARASGSYNAGDWAVAVSYDNTKTVIEGGLITSGTIQLAGGGSGGSILAGITGEGRGDDQVRIWAGGSKESRAAAPFRVTQNGELVASNAKITGEINATSGKFTGEINATSGYLRNILIKSLENVSPYYGTYYFEMKENGIISYYSINSNGKTIPLFNLSTDNLIYYDPYGTILANIGPSTRVGSLAVDRGVVFSNLPTSNNGLSAGTLYRNGNILCVAI
ncbi:MAG: hypothetical protein LBJ57_02685 [Prevotellaceae bacterium]|jgi:hypothetical protein|nr:hypothetical protein [Prevotellaceae bacterium]